MVLSNLKPYIEPILQACFIFPFVAALFTIPFMVINYRKYGGIALMRVLVVYSFILYSMCAFLLTVLPLPSREAVAAMAPHPIGWIPFRDLNVGLEKAGIFVMDPATWTDWANWKAFLKSSDLFQVAANVVMQIPLGFYLRYYFRCGWKKTLVIGFCVSLFYELTQLSGLFFIYPKPYRFTEVDDLIANTLGAMIGYWITPLLALILPSRDEIDRISYHKGQQLTLIRRMLAAVLDGMLVSSLSFAVMTVWSILGGGWKRLGLGETALFLGYFVVLPRLTGGRMPGQALLRIRVVSEDGGRPKLWQLLVRNVLLYVVEPAGAAFNIFCLAMLTIAMVVQELDMAIKLIFVIGFGSVIVLSMWAVLRSQTRWGTFPHGHYSRTRCVPSGKDGAER